MNQFKKGNFVDYRVSFWFLMKRLNQASILNLSGLRHLSSALITTTVVTPDSVPK